MRRRDADHPGQYETESRSGSGKGRRNKKQAWRRQLNEHPEDNGADIKIFHFKNFPESAIYLIRKPGSGKKTMDAKKILLVAN